MNKISKIASMMLVGSVFAFVGCGGGSSSSDNTTADNTTADNTTTTIIASDAYVVGLATPATVTINGVEYKSQDVVNGKITFTIPANADVTNATFDVPGDAIVDTDGDGQLSAKDQVIRMPLQTKGAGSVANPIATAALLKNDMEAFDAAKDFDPVESKKELITKLANDPDSVETKKLQALVAVSDSVADLAKQAQDKGVDPETVLKSVDTQVVKEVVQNPQSVDLTEVVTQTVEPAATVAGVDPQEITNKVQNTIEVMQTTAEAIKAGTIKDADEALKAVLAVSDAGVDPEAVKEAVQSGDLDAVIEQIPTDPKVQEALQQLQKEQNGEDMTEGSDENTDVTDNTDENTDEMDNTDENSDEMDDTSMTYVPTTTTTTTPTLLDKLTVTSVKFGDKKVAVQNNQFSAELDKDTTLADDYANISLDATCSATFTKSNLTFAVSFKKDGKYVGIAIQPISVKCVSGEKPVTTVPVGAKVGIETNAAGVIAAFDDAGLSVTQSNGVTTYLANVDQNLVNNDLGVKIDTLENALTSDSNSISTFVDKLNSYLATLGTYQAIVAISDDDSSTSDDTITGSVEVK
ncbi:MAG: hypothetical protein GXO40_00310 [Epsilonproteobacteria bacterium]|nr:hypothetical protein [Campylobacterota bacterium]